MRKIEDIRKRELMALGMYVLVLIVICTVAHKAAFSYAAASRHMAYKASLGGEMFVVPCILLIALGVWNVFIKSYFEEQYDTAMDAIDCLRENDHIYLVHDFNKNREKIGTYRKLYNGEIIYIPCRPHKVKERR